MTDKERWKAFVKLLNIDWDRWSYVVAEQPASMPGQLAIFAGKEGSPHYSEQLREWIDLTGFAFGEEESVFYRLGTISTFLVQISPKDSLVWREEVLRTDKLEELNRVTYGLKQARKAFTVWVNSDRTEGRGYEYPLGFYEVEVAAKRAAKGADAQGVDGRVEPITLHKVHDFWYGPVKVIAASEEDRRQEKLLQKKREEFAKIEKLEKDMLKAGFSAEDLELFLKKAAR